MIHHYIHVIALSALLVSTTIQGEGRERCFRQVSDVVIAIDSSFSIRAEEFEKQLQFLKALIDSFTIGKNNMQVGLVSFGSKVRLEFTLNQWQTKLALKKAVGKIKHMNSGTYTNEAIRFIHSQMFEEENGHRPWAKKKVVLITDGFASNLKKTLLEASRARLKGIEIFCVGVGGWTNDVELRGMASSPKGEHVFHVKDYESLPEIKAALTDATCERPMSDAAFLTASEVTKRQGDEQAQTADIFFLMDSSSSIWQPDFSKYITFVRQVTSSFTLGQDAMRVGLVVYSDRPTVLLDLQDTQTTTHLNRVLNSTTYISGGSNTAKAIEKVRKHGFTKYNRREKCVRIMVLLTDGKSDDQIATQEQARKAHEEGIRIFAIGVGKKTDTKELMAVASDPDDRFVFHVDDFSSLSTIKDLLVVKTSDFMKEKMVNDAQIPETPKQCPSVSSDVVFIYDTNSLSRHHQNLVINSIYDVIESDMFVSKNLRFGVIREAYQTRKLHDIQLTGGWRRKDFILQLDPGSKRSSAELLLKKARRAWDDDWSKKRTIIMFLDSGLKNIFAASMEASFLKKSDVKIIVVGIGKKFDSNQALFVVSHPLKENLIHLKTSTIHGRNGLMDKLLKQLCD